METKYFIVLIHNNSIKCNGFLATWKAVVITYDCGKNLDTTKNLTEIITMKLENIESSKHSVYLIKKVPAQHNNKEENVAVAFVSSFKQNSKTETKISKRELFSLFY